MANSIFNVGDVEGQIDVLSEQIGGLVKNKSISITTGSDATFSMNMAANKYQILSVGNDADMGLLFTYQGNWQALLVDYLMQPKPNTTEMVNIRYIEQSSFPQT